MFLITFSYTLLVSISGFKHAYTRGSGFNNFLTCTISGSPAIPLAL